MGQKHLLLTPVREVLIIMKPSEINRDAGKFYEKGEKNILFSAPRAGDLTEVFYEMGEIVFEDLQLLSKGLPPRLCRKAELETVKSLRSKPVDVN